MMLGRKIHTVEPLVPAAHISSGKETDTEKWNRHKSLYTDHILAEMNQAGGKPLHVHSELHKLIPFIWNKEELWQQSKYITVPIYKTGNKTKCQIRQGMLLLSTKYKLLSNILLSRLSPKIYEIIWDYYFGFWCNTPNTGTIGQHISNLYNSRNPYLRGKYCATFSLNVVYLWK
jgi:hypothetical protein